MATARSPSTSTVITQVSGQSCGQTTFRRRRLAAEVSVLKGASRHGRAIHPDRRRLPRLVDRDQHDLGLGDLHALAVATAQRSASTETLTVIEVRPTRTVSVKKLTMSPR